MSPTDAELIRAVETGVFQVPSVPGELEALEISGVQGIIAPHVTDGLVNNVGDFNVPAAKLDDTISQVLAAYRAVGNLAYWWCGPNAKPAGVESELVGHGIEYDFTLDGLVSTDLAAEISLNPQIRIESVLDDGLESASRTFSAGFVFDDIPLPEAAGRLWMTSVQSAPQHYCGRNYVAHLDGVEGAIAVASLIMLPGTKIAMLTGASTLLEHRGHGAYTALLATRFRDAAHLGAKAAIIQANQDTSSPICLRAGMRSVVNAEFLTLSSF
jgi:hypothetical protein